MRSVLFLAWRYIRFNRLKSGILIAGVALILLLPLAVSLLVNQYERQLMERSRSTPLILGARGNRFDLLLQSLYFRPGKLSPITAAAVEKVRDSDLARPIPIHARFTAESRPIIGTTLEYFEFRDLQLRSGRLPGMLGEAVVGSEAADALDLSPGDTLRSDRDNVYDLAKSLPLQMNVVGVLEETGSPDDFAVFVDVKTAWVIEGLGHGHEDLAENPDESVVLDRDEDSVTANAALRTYVEITEENLDSFHFHGDRSEYPLSSVIVVPHDDKSRTILKARYDASETRQMLVPEEVMGELTGLIFRIKRLFDLNFALIAMAMALFLALIVLLSLRLRRAERATIHKLGGSRGLVFWLQAAELGIILLISATVAGGLAGAMLLLAPRVFQVM
jgi:putative ABC transport system permease protein